MTREDALAVLQLAPGASPEQIKKQYRNLARLYHPDLSKNPHSSLLFSRLRDAYEALSALWVSKRVYEKPVANPVPIITQMAYWGKVLKESSETHQRLQAVRRLGRIGGAGSWIWLKSALKDPNESVRNETVRTLGILDLRQGLEYLGTIFLKETSSVKMTVLEQAADKNFDGGWNSFYFLAIQDANPFVRWKARQLKTTVEKKTACSGR